MVLGWDMIQYDPLLRQELNAIEQHTMDDELVFSLMQFYSRIDGLVRLTHVITDLPPVPELFEEFSKSSLP